MMDMFPDTVPRILSWPPCICTTMRTAVG
ncbi:unnamed protein product [Acanthoscelides obtectus]|uniref:Uncharacterized protein n=1 Tax=Acanthoscelides obtectus TaxID=200917 RepID=A0A9P0JZW8_ACAOB|nr:unnamed protein product [Acanthoscelides obtectus]CAK1633841.1 hypothetical protein AOBTE_LOCUS8428 [Acanthoscelides obtectus]